MYVHYSVLARPLPKGTVPFGLGMCPLWSGMKAKCALYLASFPGLLTPAFVACSTNAEEGLLKRVTCSDVNGCWVVVWRSGTVSGKPQRLSLSFVAVAQ